MAFREEIIARMGLDSSSFKRGLKEVGADVGKIGDKIGKGFAGKLASSFGVSALILGFKRLADRAADVVKEANKFRESTDNVQGLRVASERLGITMEDTVKRFREGDTLVRSIVEGAAKLTENELSILIEAKNAIDSTSNALTVGIGKIIGYIGNTAQFLGSISETADFSKSLDIFIYKSGLVTENLEEQAAASKKAKAVYEAYVKLSETRLKSAFDEASEAGKLAALLIQEEGLRKEINLTEKDTVKSLELQRQLVETIHEIRKKEKDLAADAAKKREESEKKILDLQNRELQIARASARLVNAGAALDIALADRSKFTLQELIERGFRPARQIGFLEERGRALRGFNFERSQAAFGRADEIRKAIANVLVSSEVDPFETLRTNVVEQTDALNEILRKSGEEGLIVQARSD